jgi:putative methionine-R-sulfoxide reductase with GAF domain
LGQWTLTNANLEAVIGQAVLFVEQMLEVECCGFWELLGGGDELVLKNGAGWLDGHLGAARAAVDSDSAEGTSIRQGPVIVEDWAEETRFRMPTPLRDHKLRSSLVVPVPGAGGPVGILTAHTNRPRRFSEDDIHFLQAIAVVLSLAIARKRSEESIQRLAAFPRCNPNPVIELNAEAQLTYANEAADEMARSFACESVLELMPEQFPQIVRTALVSDQAALDEQVVKGARTLSWSFFPVAPGQVHGYAEKSQQSSILKANCGNCRRWNVSASSRPDSRMITITRSRSSVATRRCC